MPQGTITKRSVDALKCPAGKDRLFLWDDDLAGFGVAAFPNGRKVFVVQYRQNGRSRRAKVGEYGRNTPDEARKQAKKLLGSVAHGLDPIALRQAEKGIPFFREVADVYMAKHVERHRKSRTRESYETLLRLHIHPSIGSKRITEIKRSHLEKLHHDMGGKPGAANRALSVISAVWTWAATKTYADLGLPPCPAKGIERNREEGKERYLSTEELGRLGDALAIAETTGLPYDVKEGPKAKHAAKAENRSRRLDPYAVAAIRLLMFTGARLREVLHARWEEIDIERGLLNLPAARSKTGQKSIYLSAAALQILNALPRVEGNPHVIPGDATAVDGSGLPRADLKAPWRAVTAAAGLKGLRLHDLRHTFASFGAGASLGLPIIGKLLGHTQPATTARYAHLDADPVRRAANTIGATISAALEGRKAADPAALRKEPAKAG